MDKTFRITANILFGKHKDNKVGLKRGKKILFHKNLSNVNAFGGIHLVIRKVMRSILFS
jgi:hypothetical protein